MSRSRLIELYIQKHNGELLLQEKKELNSLRFQHSAYYDYLQSIGNDPNLLEQLKLIDKESAIKRTLHNVQSPQRRRFISVLKVAALLLVLVSSSIVYWYTPTKDQTPVVTKSNQPGTIQNSAQLITSDQVYNLSEVKGDAIDGTDFKIVKNENNNLSYKKLADTTIFHTVKTDFCNQYSVVLSDGSTIHINSNSKVRYPVTLAANKREIFVEGEVYCEIAKSNIPFVVHTSHNKEITVLGTKFNVRDYQGEEYTEVTLVEGSVRVNDTDNTCMLKPNQQVTITDNFKIKEVESLYYSSWTKPIIRFHNMKLQRVINSFEQLYGVSFEFKTPVLKERLVAGGIIKSKSIEENIMALAESCNLDVTKQSGNYIIKESLSN